MENYFQNYRFEQRNWTKSRIDFKQVIEIKRVLRGTQRGIELVFLLVQNILVSSRVYIHEFCYFYLIFFYFLNYELCKIIVSHRIYEVD